MSDKNEPAFPRPASEGHARSPDQHGYGEQAGMTLRDYFAAKAMQGMVGDQVRELIQQKHLTALRTKEVLRNMAVWAYVIADVMLAARKDANEV